MVKIYTPGGAPSLNSSAGRCLLLLEDLGIEYERVGLELSKGEHKSENYMQMNPNGKIPCLVDGDFVLWESMAINDYLAKKYKPELLGNSLEEQALIQQWNYWLVTEYQPPVVKIVMNMRSAQGPDMTMIEAEKQKILKLNSVIEKTLEGKEFLVGNSFTIADLHIGLGISVCHLLGVDLSQYPNIGKWIHSIMSRPSFQKLATPTH